MSEMSAGNTIILVNMLRLRENRGVGTFVIFST